MSSSASSCLPDTGRARRLSDRLVVVDPNVRPGLYEMGAYRSRLGRLARVRALFKLSVADVHALYPDGGGAARLLELGAAAVVVTNGSHGATVLTPLCEENVEAPVVDVVDAVGAGDAFTAGLLAWLWRAGQLGALEAASWRDALEYAVAAGAAQCMRTSAWGPSAADVDHLLASEFTRGG